MVAASSRIAVPARIEQLALETMYDGHVNMSESGGDYFSYWGEIISVLEGGLPRNLHADL